MAQNDKEDSVNKEVGMTTIELIIPDTYIDDDNMFSTSTSWKRRLSIVEKVLIILVSIATIPLSAWVSTFIPTSENSGVLVATIHFNPFSPDLWSISLVPYILSFVILICAEFYFKNFSMSKGILKTTISSLLLSVLINVALFTLCTSFREVVRESKEDIYFPYIMLGLIDGIIYTLILLIARISLKIINNFNKKRVILVGPKEDADSLAKKMIKEDSKKYTIRYIFYEVDGKISNDIFTKLKKVNTIILLDTLSAKNKEELIFYFSSCKNKDLMICSSFFDLVFLDSALTNVNEKMAFDQRPLFIDMIESTAKRLVDIFLSIIALILLSPLMLITALVIKLQDGGPVLYKQTRLTKNLKPFTIYKFRSMKVNAEKNGKAQLASENDERITKFGKFIRGTRIDELPQIFNILKGDMSWVGPRPERPDFVYEFIKENPLYRYRYNVKAGLTGLQQVSASYHTTFEDKLKYDLYYIEKQSTVFDIIILFKTIGVVFKKEMAAGIDPEEMNLPLEEFLDNQDYTFKQHENYYSVYKPTDIQKKK